MIRRAIEQILSDSKLGEFNSLEIVEIGGQGPQVFPILGSVTVRAQPRHVQQILFLNANGRSDLDGVGSGPTESRTAKEKLRFDVVETTAL